MWQGLVLTSDGQKALNNAQLSNKINFKSILIGDGTRTDDFESAQSLVHQLYEITDLLIDVTENGCTLTADFPKVDYDYYFREVGIVVTTDEGDKLYVYDNCGEDAQYIVNSSAVEATQKRLRLSLIISHVSEITVSSPSVLYVDIQTFNERKESIDSYLVDVVGGKEEAGQDVYSSNTTYAVGDYCIFNDVLYKCTEAIDTAEEFNIEHWNKTSIVTELAEMNANALAIVVGDSEPKKRPVFWFNTTKEIESDEAVSLLQLGDDEKSAVVTADVDGTEYSVLNTAEPVAEDDSYIIEII